MKLDLNKLKIRDAVWTEEVLTETDRLEDIVLPAEGGRLIVLDRAFKEFVSRLTRYHIIKLSGIRETIERRESVRFKITFFLMSLETHKVIITFLSALISPSLRKQITKATSNNRKENHSTQC